MSVTEGLQRREAGFNRLELSNKAFLECARNAARMIALNRGTPVTADDVRLHAEMWRYGPKSRNAWGAIFRGADWVPVGMTRSEHPGNNGRRIIKWGLRGVTRGCV